MKQYAVIRKWKDNPNDFQVLEYCETIESANEYIKEENKRHNKTKFFEYDIMKYS